MTYPLSSDENYCYWFEAQHLATVTHPHFTHTQVFYWPRQSVTPFPLLLPAPSSFPSCLISYCQIQLHGPSFLLKRIRTAKGALKFGEKDKVSFLLKLFCKKKLFVQLKNSKDLCTCAQNIKTPEGRKL